MIQTDKEEQELIAKQTMQQIASANVPTILTHKVHVGTFFMVSKPDKKGKVVKQGQILLNFTDIVSNSIIARFALNLSSAKDLKIVLEKSVDKLEKDLISTKVSKKFEAKIIASTVGKMIS